LVNPATLTGHPPGTTFCGGAEQSLTLPISNQSSHIYTPCLLKDDNKFEELGHGPWPGASLLHGQLDEEAEAIAFQEAVAAWRNAGGLAHWGDASVDKVSKSIFPLKRCRNEKLKKTGMEALESVHFFCRGSMEDFQEKGCCGGRL